jgi:hypothetical protein
LIAIAAAAAADAGFANALKLSPAVVAHKASFLDATFFLVVVVARDRAGSRSISVARASSSSSLPEDISIENVVLIFFTCAVEAGTLARRRVFGFVPKGHRKKSLECDVLLEHRFASSNFGTMPLAFARIVVVVIAMILIVVVVVRFLGSTSLSFSLSKALCATFRALVVTKILSFVLVFSVIPFFLRKKKKTKRREKGHVSSRILQKVFFFARCLSKKTFFFLAFFL